MQVGVLVSGGKDSALALYRVLEEGSEIKRLIVMVPEKSDSWMFHFPDVDLIRLFADASGFPLVMGETVGIKEEEVEDLVQVLRGLNLEGVVCGAIASRYQRDQIEGICEKLGLISVFPLWGEDGVKLLDELVDLGFEAVVSRVAAMGLGKEWLGRRIDEEAIGELVKLNHRFGVSVVGEGGEYETLVLDAPFFRKKKIELVDVEKIWEEQNGYLKVKKTHLIDK